MQVLKNCYKRLLITPKNRHVYDVDTEGRQIGAVCMSSALQYLVPCAGMRINTNEWVLGGMPLISRLCVTDLMNDRPDFVQPETLLTGMGEIMIA